MSFLRENRSQFVGPSDRGIWFPLRIRIVHMTELFTLDPNASKTNILVELKGGTIFVGAPIISNIHNLPTDFQAGFQSSLIWLNEDETPPSDTFDIELDIVSVEDINAAPSIIGESFCDFNKDCFLGTQGVVLNKTHFLVGESPIKHFYIMPKMGAPLSDFTEKKNRFYLMATFTTVAGSAEDVRLNISLSLPYIQSSIVR